MKIIIRSSKLFVSLIILFIILLCSCTNDSKDQSSKPSGINDDKLSYSFREDTVSQYKIEMKYKESIDIIKNNKINDTNNTLVKKSVNKADKKIIAYYFHPTARCPTCINIENFTKEVVETQFSKENIGGLISFKQLNIEDTANEHYIDDYKLEFSSLILTKYINNKRVKWKNLVHVWKYANEKEKFFIYVTNEIKQFMKEKEDFKNAEY